MRLLFLLLESWLINVVGLQHRNPVEIWVFADLGFWHRGRGTETMQLA